MCSWQTASRHIEIEFLMNQNQLQTLWQSRTRPCWQIHGSFTFLMVPVEFIGSIFICSSLFPCFGEDSVEGAAVTRTPKVLINAHSFRLLTLCVKMMEMEVYKEQEIKQIEMGKPHVVILGAGASYAAFPNGDFNGKKLPLMNTLVETLGLEKLIEKAGLKTTSFNFEDIYSEIHEKPDLILLREELEKRVYSYFQGMEFPDEPTIYDHLLLAFRGKDVVATFNWDPFLLLAYQRNAQRFKLPRLLFLHGNVGVGYCAKDKVAGIIGNRCSKCGCALEPTKLFYPISDKNYHLDGFISLQWKELSQHLQHAFMITIFGYGAPQSDVSAIDLMKSAWGDVNSREMEQTEIIDIRNEEELRNTWEPFIHTHHYETHSSFYDSWIANHPRRTGEAYINQYWNAHFIENNPIPKEFSFSKLWAWYDQLQEVEKQNENTKQV